MAQYLNLPSGNSFLLNEGEDPQQGWLRALKEHPEQFGFAKSGPKPEGGFIPALSAGLSRLAGETALTAGKLGILDLPRAEELYSLQQKKAEQIFKPAEGGWTESPWQKFKEVAGGSAAYMLAPAAAAFAGAAAPVSVPLIGAAGLGAGLVSLGQFTGSNIAAQMAEGKTLEQASGATAAVAAVPQAALDVLSFRMIPGLQRFFGATGKEITEAQAKALAEQTLKQKVGDYAVATGRTMGVEGVTEVAQDVIEKLQAGAEIADPKAREDYLESLIGGAALAAVLGPLGRGLERRQIGARGQELEKERLAAEAAAREKAQQEALAAQTEFRLAPPEGPMGPFLPADTQTQRIQARLSEIENEVAAARQAKDMDALLNLMRERNTLEAQAEELAPEQTAFERRRGMEQQQSALESLEAQLQAEARQATNVADKRAVLERLVAVQKQRRDLEKEFERAEAKGEIPTLVEHKKLLDAEKRAVRALQAAEEKGDAAGQLKAAAKLEELQGQLGLFGMESFAAQEQDAARSRAQEALQASGRTLRLPAPVAPTIPLGSTRTAPVQETLFFDQPSTEDVQQRIREIEAKIEQAIAAKDGRRVYELLQERQELEPKLTVPTQSFERQYEVSTDQTGMPQQQLQQAVSTLATKPDLKPEDRALLERVQEVATPASGLPQTEAIQAKIDALDQRSAALTRELEKQKSRPGRLATLRQDLQRQFDAAQRRVAELSEKLRIYEKDVDKLNTLLKTAKTDDEAKTIRANKATEEANIANLKQNLDAANTEVIQLDNRLKAVARRVDATDAKSVRKIAALERRLAAIARQKSQLSETPTAQPSLLERLSTTGAARARQRVEEIQKEIDAIERGTQADTTLSGRQKLDRIAQLKEEQARLRQETVSLRQRITDWLSDTARGLDNTNSRQALEDALQQVEAAQRGFDAQQTDLFAGTEAERSVEFQTPEQFQKFMASEELNNLRRQQGLLKPTVAYLQKQTSKIQTILKDLNAKLKLFTNLQKARTESAEKAQNAAKAKYAEAWQKVLEGLPEEHSKYAYAKLELENATATYAGLIDLQKAAMDALDSDLRKDSVWAAYDEREKARFFAALQAPKQAWEAALTRLTELRQQIAKAQIGEATDPYTALWPEYSAAQKEAQKAYEAFQKVIRDRKKIVPPANAVVADKEIKNFLAQDAELTEMLIAQQRAIYKFERMLFAAQEQLETAKASLRQDPLLKNYFDALEEAISIAADSTKAPVTLMESALTDSFLKLPAAIKKANEELNKLQQQTAPSPGATAGERYERYTDPNRAAEIKKELELLQTERDKLANALRNKEVIKTDTGVALVPKRKYLGAAPEKFAGIVTAQELLRTAATSVKDERITALTPKTRVALLDGRIEELQRELDSIDRYKLSRRERRLQEIKAEEQRQQKVSEDIQAENERLAREAEATTRVTFEPLRPEQQRALDEAKQQLDTLIKNKQAAIEKKENQKKNFRLSSELQKAVAEGKKTKAEAVEEQRTADIKKISDMFDTQIEQKQAQIRAIRGVSRPSERREAQARQTQALQRDIGQPVTMSQEMQEELLTTAEKKAIDDGTKTLDQVMADRKRAGRTGKAVVHVRTGRVSEARRAVSKRDLTKAEQDVENAEANRLSAQFAADAEERYLKGLLTYAKTQLDLDLSHLADDVVAVEYAILNAQATQEEKQYVESKRKSRGKRKNTADEIPEEYDVFDVLKAVKKGKGPYNRITSSEYTDRENTPLDETTAAAVGKGNLIQALTSLAENGSTPFVRMVAKRLLPMVENTSLETASLEGKGGEFDPNTNTITLNKDALTEEDLIHEPVHAATIGVIDAKPDTLTKEQLDARTALEKLYAKMQSRPEFKDEYANVSFKEFVSELLSNQQVRDKINQTAGLLRRIYEGFLRMLGIEPTTLSDKAVEQAFAMFSPSQATLNREERLSSIMRGVFPGTSTKFSSAVPQGVQDAVNKTIARTATLGDKLMANTMGLRLRTFIADQWAPVEALLKMGVEKGKIKEAQALQMRVYMRLFSNQQEYTNAALLNGVPELMKDKTGVRNIEGGDEKANARTIAAALSKAKALGNEQAIERTFTFWMAGLRAKQDGVGFEKLNFSLKPEELAKIKASLAELEDQVFKKHPEVKAAFDEARALYKEHNKRLLNLQVQTGAMSQDVANELSKGDYIGYYRVNNNGVVELMLGGSRPMRIGSVVDQPYLKELVGGEQHILPFFSSMVQNTSMLMTIALKNMQNTNTSYMFQDLGLGKIHSVPDGKQPPMGKIRFKQGGNDYWFEADESAFEAAGVPADLMMQGLQGVKTAVPALVRGLAVPANFLRKAIRRVPTYTLRQTIRDPMHAWMVTGGKFTPILGTWKELAKGMTGKSDTQLTLQQAAVIGNNVYSGDAEGVADMLRTLTSEPSKFSQTMMKFDEFAMRGEAATRAVLYDMFRKKGMGHVEALLNTAETMNFSRRGTSASLAWLSMLTPFFNAQIQGLDSVYRALKGDSTFEEKMNARNKLLARGALMFISSMFYAWLMEDDEAYKNATPAERYGNWFVRVPGTDKTVRVPIPFELGLIFKSMPEAFMNTAFGDTKASEAAKAIGKQIWMSTPGGIPTAVKGPIELMANYSFYNDQPIETDREKAMDVDQRYRTGTTELAKLLGKAGVLSPVQIDHLVRSYLSSAGIMLASMANFALRPLTSREGVEKPEMALEEMPLFGSMFQPRTGRGMVNAAFDDMHRLERAANTYKTLAASDPKAAQEYANDYAREIGLASFAGRFRQQMGEFAKYKRMIAANPDLTPAEKRQQIEAVKEQEIRYSTMLRKAAA